MTDKEHLDWVEFVWKLEYELYTLQKRHDKALDKAYALGFVYGIITFVLGVIGGRWFL